MTIQRIDNDLPARTKISQLNEMILQLNGYIEQGRFNKFELDQLYDNIAAARKFERSVGIGNTVSTYGSWSHLHDESGYSIWKYTPDNYAYEINNKLYRNGIVLENRGEASAESAQAFDNVFLWNGDSGSGYTDNTTEAATELGTGFSLMDTKQDFLYLGLSTTFSGVKFNWKTRGSNYTLVIEYWTGTEWLQITTSANNLEEATRDFRANGHITFETPSNWNTTTINSQNKYWLRISSTTDPITISEAYYIIPATSVIGLLALSGNEVLNEEWAWCSYNGSIYATIRNQGNSSVEGNYFIQSSSSSSNKENFFVHNNPFTADYKSSLFDPVKEISTTSAIVATDGVILANSSTGSITLTLPSAHTNEGMEFVIKKVNSSNNVVIETESGEAIDGSGTKTLSSQYSFVRLISDNGNWYIIGGA